MNSKGWLAALCLIAGIPLAAYGLSGGGAFVSLTGLALVLAFWYFAWQWIAKSGKAQVTIKPAANAAWGMRDQAVGSTHAPLFPSPSSAERGGEENGGAAHRGEE
jgi:hypothetical protein